MEELINKLNLIEKNFGMVERNFWLGEKHWFVGKTEVYILTKEGNRMVTDEELLEFLKLKKAFDEAMI